MSIAFWLTMMTSALFIAAILTASYNEDKTKGL